MRAVLATFAVALLLALGLGLWTAQRTAALFYFETEVQSTVSGRAQLYFDRGGGFNEPDSASQAVTAGNPQRLRLPIPAGEVRAFRFDLIDREGTVSFSQPRILTPAGTIVTVLDPARWTPNEQIARFDRGDTSQVVARRGVNDPYLSLSFAPALRLELTPGRRLWDARWRWLSFTGFAWAALLVVRFGWRRRDVPAGYAASHPQRAIIAVAACSALLATYPVALAGKSFVSPNIVPLLRQSLPTIPGHHDLTQVDLRTPDPAAMLWQNVPYSMVQHEAVFRHGELPLWNRYSSAGLTLLGQGQSMIGDPVHLLVIAARGAAWAWDVKFILARLLFAGGLGLFVWTLTRSLRAALLSALAAPFVGFFNFRFNHPAIFTFAYSPWILLGWARWLSRTEEPAKAAARWQETMGTHLRRVRPAILIVMLANLAVLGSGTVKEAYALLGVLNGVGFLAWAFSPCPNPGQRGREALMLGVVAVLLLLITAPLWLTFFSALGEAFTVYERPQVWQAPSWLLVGLLDSLFYVELHANHWGYLAAANLVFGLGALSALGPVALGRSIAARPRVFGGMLVAVWTGCVAIAFGFVPAEWIARVPLLQSVYHVHNTFSVPAVVLLCAFGGMGLHWVSLTPARRSLWPAGAVVLVLLFVYFRGQPDTWRNGDGLVGWARGLMSHRFFVVNVALGAVATGVLLRWLRADPNGTRRRHALDAVTVALALVVLLYRHGLHLPLGIGDTYLTHPMVRAELAAPSSAMTAARADAGAEPFRLIGTEANVLNGWNAVYGVESINGPDAVMNRPYRELAEAAGLVTPGEWRFSLGHEAIGAQRAWLDFVGVRYIASDRALTIAPYTLVGEFDLWLYRSESAWPRAYFASAAIPYESPRHLVERIRSESAPFAAWDAADPAARAAFAPLVATSSEPARVIRATDFHLTANTTSFRVRAPGPGLVVLQETWSARDFQATLNGEPAPYYRINHAFKAVPIPAAGDYTVRFTFWPETLTLALALAAFGMTALFWLLVVWPRTPSR